MKVNFVTLIALLSYAAMSSSLVFALGNHPEAGTCPVVKPYYVFCSHALHNLEGWVGGCHKSRDAAQPEANKHVDKRHAGNSRWTGVLKVRGKR
jgi:hypothetical protein